MITLTITIPLSSIPGVEIEAAYEHLYADPTVEGVELSRFALELTGEVWEDYGFSQAAEGERARPYAGTYKMSKPRLVVLP